MVLVAGTATLFAIAVIAPALPQDPAYHRFADTRTLFGIPRALDVISSGGFAVVGMSGLVLVATGRPRFLSSAFAASAFVSFVGLLITAAASASYHLAPDDAGLARDRHSMAVVFAGVLGMVASERISDRAGSLWRASACSPARPPSCGGDPRVRDALRRGPVWRPARCCDVPSRAATQRRASVGALAARVRAGQGVRALRCRGFRADRRAGVRSHAQAPGSSFGGMDHRPASPHGHGRPKRDRPSESTARRTAFRAFVQRKPGKPAKEVLVRATPLPHQYRPRYRPQRPLYGQVRDMPAKRRLNASIVIPFPPTCD